MIVYTKLPHDFCYHVLFIAIVISKALLRPKPKRRESAYVMSAVSCQIRFPADQKKSPGAENRCRT